MPTKLNTPNIIAGNALVSHFTFYPQRDYILGTDILGRYAHLAHKVYLEALEAQDG